MAIAKAVDAESPSVFLSRSAPWESETTLSGKNSDAAKISITMLTNVARNRHREVSNRLKAKASLMDFSLLSMDRTLTRADCRKKFGGHTAAPRLAHSSSIQVFTPYLSLLCQALGTRPSNIPGIEGDTRKISTR